MDYPSHQHNTTMTRCWGFNVGKLEMEKKMEGRKICLLLHGDRHLNMLGLWFTSLPEWIVP